MNGTIDFHRRGTPKIQAWAALAAGVALLKFSVWFTTEVLLGFPLLFVVVGSPFAFVMGVWFTVREFRGKAATTAQALFVWCILGYGMFPLGYLWVTR